MADNHTEVPPPAYNAAPGHSPSSNEMLSPNPTHATPVSPEVTGLSQQQTGIIAGSSEYIAPPLQQPMGAAPYVPQNQAFSPSPLTSPEMQNVQPAQEREQQHNMGQHSAEHQQHIHQAPQANDLGGETTKSLHQSDLETQPQPGLETHPTMDAKYISEGQQQEQQPHGQQENMTYPSTGVYQTAIPLTDLGRVNAPVDCPRCNVRGLTEVEAVSGGFTHLLAVTLCCCFCLGCFPYCIDGTKDVNHKCSNCKSLLAVWHRSNSRAVVVAFK